MAYTYSIYKPLLKPNQNGVLIIFFLNVYPVIALPETNFQIIIHFKTSISIHVLARVGLQSDG